MAVQDLDGLVELFVIDLGGQQRAAAANAFGVKAVVVGSSEQVLQHAPETLALGLTGVQRIEGREFVASIGGRKCHASIRETSLPQQADRFIGIGAIIKECRDGMDRHRLHPR